MHAFLRFLVAFATLFATVSLAPAADGQITVFAAASLTNALQQIDAAYTKTTAVPVKESFASSSTLARQIEAGAPAQVFISADTKWMHCLEHKGFVAEAWVAVAFWGLKDDCLLAILIMCLSEFMQKNRCSIWAHGSLSHRGWRAPMTFAARSPLSSGANRRSASSM